MARTLMSRRAPAALVAVLAAAAGSAARAHDPEAEARWMLERKLAEPWVAANGFTTDLGDALQKASADRPVLAVFTISYAEYEQCVALESQVLASPEFAELAKRVVPFLHVDSGLADAQSGLLAEKGGFEVPYVAVLDAQGRVTGRAETLDVAGLAAAVKASQELVALRRKPDRTTEESVALLAREMDLAALSTDDAKRRIAELGELSAEQRARLDAASLALEIRVALGRAAGGWEAGLAAGRRFAELWAAGRRPRSGPLVRPFLLRLLDHAQASKDAGLFREALDALRERFGEDDDPFWEDFFPDSERRLAALEKAAREAAEKEVR